MALPPRTWRVKCAGLKDCGWLGYRQADSLEEAIRRKVCPGCGEKIGPAPMKRDRR